MNIASSLTQHMAGEGVNFAPQIVSAAARHGIDPALLAAVAAQETGGPGSNGGANIVGDGGHGRGLFQIDDRWHDFARSAAAMNPGKNADYAAGMLSGLLKRYGGDVRKALSSYNAGSPTATGTKTTWGDGATLGYADSVLRHYGTIADGAAPDDLEEARACQSDDSASANSLLAQLSSFGAMPPPAFMLPQPPPYTPWNRTEGLDATGHTRNPQSDPYAQGDDDQ